MRLRMTKQKWPGNIWKLFLIGELFSKGEISCSHRMWPTLALRNLGKPGRQKRIPFESSCSCNFKIEGTERLRAQLDACMHHHLAVCERVPKTSYHPSHLNHRYSKLVLWASSRQPGAGHGDGQAHLLLHPFCNPKWPNIPWGCETTSDRRDLCARVCRAKLLHIKARIKLKDLLGEVVYFVYSIE